MMVIALHSGVPHSTMAMILKNKNKEKKAIDGSASLKSRYGQKFRHGEAFNVHD